MSKKVVVRSVVAGYAHLFCSKDTLVQLDEKLGSIKDESGKEHDIIAKEAGKITEIRLKEGKVPKG